MQTIELRVLRLTLSLVWLWTAMVSCGLYPVEQSLAILDQAGLDGSTARVALALGVLIDTLMGLGTLLLPGRALWLAQGLLVTIYSTIITFALPAYWLHPFGPVLKNLPILALLWLLYRQEGKRT